MMIPSRISRDVRRYFLRKKGDLGQELQLFLYFLESSILNYKNVNSEEPAKEPTDSQEVQQEVIEISENVEPIIQDNTEEVKPKSKKQK